MHELPVWNVHEANGWSDRGRPQCPVSYPDNNSASHLLSNAIYLFNCECGHGYVGRTSQRLEECIRQHVPVGLVAMATSIIISSSRNHQRNRWKLNTPWCYASNPGEQLKRRHTLKTKPQMTKPRMTELWKLARLTAALPGT